MNAKRPAEARREESPGGHSKRIPSWRRKAVELDETLEDAEGELSAEAAT